MHGYGIYLDMVKSRRFEGCWKRGEKTGNFRVYDQCGGVFEGFYIHDKLDGKTSYDIGDKLKIETNW